ncbi:MAG: acetyl-CoA hydrolase/transferase C-terminal domain-containing protein [Halieaceae bacterium]|nr:acetyl-CoA hydrolase/transferase C-terminal domain-containing protein [Halieaceae bacterium]
MTRFCETAAEAVAGIKSGEYIWCHSMAATPTVLLEALAGHARQCTDLTLMQLHLEHAGAVCGSELHGHLRHRVFFAGKDTRDLINAGLADYVPIFLSELPKLFRRGEQRVDTALIQVSSPDQHGNCTLGISVEATKAACEVADRVIAHVNPSMPRTHGDAFIPLDAIDIAYVEDAPLITIDPRPANEVTTLIGEHIASLIEDGDCLQMGIGAIPDAALANLGDRRHLGVHTEMFSDGLLPLVECGAVDNSLKKRQRGKIVTGFAMGSDNLYRFVDDNPEVIFLDIEYVNDPTVIARNKHVVSINSAIQIDLSGQICADSMGPRVYSGVGGQVDFVLGAAFSEGGKSIIALPSTAQDGQFTRLVTMLTRGSGVVTTRAHVDYIITEYGIARLRGHSVIERARELIEIAHPDFRETLLREAHDELGLRL